MVDETRADLMQDKKIRELEKRIEALEARPVPQDNTEIKAKLDELDPLRTLLEHIVPIKRFFGQGG